MKKNSLFTQSSIERASIVKHTIYFFKRMRYLSVFPKCCWEDVGYNLVTLCYLLSQASLISFRIKFYFFPRHFPLKALSITSRLKKYYHYERYHLYNSLSDFYAFLGPDQCWHRQALCLPHSFSLDPISEPRVVILVKEVRYIL